MEINYKIESREERIEIVNKIIEEQGENLSPKDLEKLSDYILFAMDKNEKKEKTIITPNRKVTLDKRETSYEELGEKLVNEEDIQTFITNDKNIIFNNTLKITEKDLKEIPELKRLHDEIAKVKEMHDKAEGKRKSLLRKQIIEMCKDQYIIKKSHYQPFFFNKVKRSDASSLDLSESIRLKSNGDIESDGLVSLTRSEDVANILKNYGKLKTENFDVYNSDIKWIIDELSQLINKLDDFYKDLTLLKIQGMQNVEIQKFLEDKYGTKHSLEYLSSLWKHKIPKKIAEIKKTEWLLWYYEQYKPLEWKACTKCGELKPKHNRFFSKNKTSKDGFYSICKCCRNNK